ncbi:MAG: ArsR/SmtB family transcription factor [Thermoplasmatota archaeon]
MPMTTLADLLAALAALDNPHRLRIIATLHQERLHVSELARRIGISRPLLYMHLEKLEAAGLVTGTHELEGGKAMKYLEVRPFDLRLDPAAIAALEDA